MRNLVDLMHNIPVLVNPVTPLLQSDIAQPLNGHSVMTLSKRYVHPETTKWWNWSVSIKPEILAINSYFKCFDVIFTSLSKSSDTFAWVRCLTISVWSFWHAKTTALKSLWNIKTMNMELFYNTRICLNQNRNLCNQFRTSLFCWTTYLSL